MIPWRLQFSGIRDYGPTEMNLDTANEHVMITGPNGSGKSTISFCMGAVLRSSKVDVSGLKSQNLLEDETWRASVRFLFKNEGLSRIDGPLYIEFRILCEQQPNQAIKLHYEIHDGDEINNLEIRQTYRSGDVNQNNFTAYQRELEYKYKIHPDLYYLIWYQQEVNQFAVMAPEERFRIFSEMHGITNIQKNWEMSLEVVKEARESFVTATTQQKHYEMDLGIAETKKNQYENNRHRLKENGLQYARATKELQLQAEDHQKDMHRFIEDRTEELNDLLDEKRKQQAQLSEERQEQQTIEQRQKEYTRELTDKTTLLKTKEKKTSEISIHVKELTGELSDVREAYQKLAYPEAQTKEKLLHAQDQVIYFEGKEQEEQERVRQTAEKIEKNRQEQSHIQAIISHWKERSKEAYALIKRYASSHQLKEQVNKQQSYTSLLQKELDKQSEELQENKGKLEMLKRNKIESPRQQTAIRHLKHQGIKAYPFRHFVRLTDNVTIEKERHFDAVKYSVFYDASACRPANDLYHVSLKNIIPRRLLTELPQWGIQMRDGLSDVEKNQAARVLWWVNEFHTDILPTITNNTLVDQQGVRGPQEDSTFILSEKAVEEQRKAVQQQIKHLIKHVQTLKEKLQAENEKLLIWNTDIRKVEEAEAFLTTKAEQDYRITHVTELEKIFSQLQKDKQLFEQEAKAHWEQTYHLKEEVKRREADVLVYKQFGEQSKKINYLHALEQTLKEEKEGISAIKTAVDTIQNELDHLENQKKISHRTIAEVEDAIERNKRSMHQVQQQRSEKEDERIATSNQAIRYKEELDELKQLIPEIVEEVLGEERIKESKFELQNIQNQAKVGFEHARSEKNIDPYAIENYETLEAEVKRKKEELISAKNLLEENEERAIQNEQKLDSAIRMQVQKIHLHFEQYMGEFQFEGRVRFDRSSNKKDRPIFKLYIEVRKEGHRGKFEDVSVKARGGRVGKGVSGGEESLSSLLFALSLLQNLENRSSFIVMDEFDSALDETRKTKVFELYANKLQRKLIIISPKGHENEYYNRFSKAFVVSHNPIELISTVKGLRMK